eukprot:CAMPEP_0181298570 /NCGR_PEP_ID=MMETSP1101-20121128/5855_1 /TAXON_ID=46948 /ORGANISM="Rhodomonas abbreviata, Strain Caron Lab Isolate" /LENGTH=222 /DNA_ID=CAMNT_0023403605 /DNA_START=131 /DNA_END=799 /DNA_ORIENTATION=+
MGNEISSLVEPVADLFSKHPHLDKYFAELEKTAKEANDEMERVMLAGDYGALGEARENIQKREEEMEQRLATHAINAFKHYDQNRKGFLEADESKVFFQHYVSCYFDYFERFGLFKEKVACQMHKDFAGMDIKEETDKKMQEITKHARDKLTSYEQNEAELSKAAFEVLDVNKNGKLQHQEVVDALAPRHPMNIEFHVALGMMTEAEAKAVSEQAGRRWGKI